MSAAAENIVQNKTVSIYTTTHTHDSHYILKFYIQQNIHTSMSLFKNIPSSLITFPLGLIKNKLIQKKSGYYGRVHIGHGISPPKEYIIYTPSYYLESSIEYLFYDQTF